EGHEFPVDLLDLAALRPAGVGGTGRGDGVDRRVGNRRARSITHAHLQRGGMRKARAQRHGGERQSGHWVSPAGDWFDMGRIRGGWIVAPLALLPALAAGAADDVGNSLFWIELRPRYNHIEESDKPLTTQGGTLRAIAGWRSAPWYGLRFTAEGIYADRIGPKHFSDEFDPASP